jgi:hypothetical protein
MLVILKYTYIVYITFNFILFRKSPTNTAFLKKRMTYALFCIYMYIRMLSRQLLTTITREDESTECSCGSIQWIAQTPKQETRGGVLTQSSSVNIQTPTLVPRSGMSTPPSIATETASSQKCPSQKPSIERDKDTTLTIPITQNVSPKYTTQTSIGVFDPTIINTPPSEFMNQLKGRLQVYFQS